MSAETTRTDACRQTVPARPIVCERCRKGPHHDGYPPITSASEAIDLGWSRTDTGLLDEECAAEVLANDYPPFAA